MATRSTPASLLSGQASALRTQLGGVFDGDTDAVHQARVATRRIREVLALVPLAPDEGGQEDDLEASCARIGRALGRVRDTDVQIALIKELEAHTPQAAPSLVLVRQDYDADRLKKMRRLIKTLERLDVDALLHAICAQHSALRARVTSTGWRAQLRSLLAERAETALDQIGHATGVYFPKRAHSARIAIKRLRYAAEIMEATGRQDLAPAIKSLTKAQAILGDLHDRQELADRLSRYQKHDGVQADHVKVTRQVLSGEVLALHAKYLARRAAVRSACVEIQDVASTTAFPARELAIGGAIAATGIALARWRLADRTGGDAPRVIRPPIRALA
jgi:CHAD domain-containing protein